VVETVFQSQRELLDAVRELYSITHFELDPTFGAGALHRGRRHPDLCFDLVPRNLIAAPADVLALPLPDASVGTIIFDPPFLAGGGTTSVMHQRYSSFSTVRELYEFYGQSLVELRRVLKPNGLLVFKCQDINNGRSQGFSHCEIYRMALDIGLYAHDLFILTSSNRMRPYKMKTQKHARKSHCYFWVFKKCSRKNHAPRAVTLPTPSPQTPRPPSSEAASQDSERSQ
jgi:hypothetical protein